MEQAKTQVAEEFPAICHPCYSPASTSIVSKTIAHFVATKLADRTLVLSEVEVDSQATSDAATLRFSSDGAIYLLDAGAVTSYEEMKKREESPSCLFLAPAPGDELLIVNEDRSLLCSKFSLL